jgi:hypothetical protein
MTYQNMRGNEMTYQGFEITVSQYKAIEKLAEKFGTFANVNIIDDIGDELQAVIKDDFNMVFQGASFNYWINRRGIIEEDNN